MLDGVAEPFELNANYYTETDKQAKTWNRYTVIDGLTVLSKRGIKTKFGEPVVFGRVMDS